MNFVAIYVSRIAFGIAVFFFVLFCFPDILEAKTIILSDITTDTTWTASSSPYHIENNISIPPGMTLTIEPGVVVKFPGSRIMDVRGNLIVNGTETEPVYFTANTDDTVGGDSNEDGSNTAPSVGYWRTMQFYPDASAEFNHTVIRYAGYSNSKQKTLPAIVNYGADITLVDTVLEYNKNYNLVQEAGSLTLNNSTVRNTSYGLLLLGGSAVIENSLFENNLNSGLQITGAANLILTNNTFSNNNSAADLNLATLGDFTHQGNSANGGNSPGFIIRNQVNNSRLLAAGDTMPYIVTGGGGLNASGAYIVATANNLEVGTTGSLEFAPGSIIKFDGSAELKVFGVLNALGNKDEPIYFTSIKDDTVGGYTNSDGNTTPAATGEWKRITLNTGSQTNFDYVTVSYAGKRVGNDLEYTGLLNQGGNLSIQNSIIKNNHRYGLVHKAGAATISQSEISGHSALGVFNRTTIPLDARNNYWGDPSGPLHSTNPAGQGNGVSNDVLYAPWLSVFCLENCNSSVLFLPGIQASTLYKDDDQIWPPNALFNNDIYDLSMSPSGESVNEIHTEGVLQNIPAGGTVYADFARFMLDLVQNGTIKSWTPFAYDWRYSVTDIAKDGTRYSEGIRDAIAEIEYLAANSYSGKVTIIGHSNGGLLAKAIMLRLETEGKSHLVDKVIFLASPQLGTPKAIGTMLHGYDQTDKLGGIIIDGQTVRQVINNLPGAYSLLPSEKYFAGQAEPIVSFDNNAVLESYRSAFGSNISNFSSYVAFLKGQGGADRGLDAAISTPATVNPGLFDEAMAMHLSELDNWTAPEGVAIVEIVGTGLPTMKSVEYRGLVEEECTVTVPFDLFCTPENKIKPYAVLTHYGDGTVVQRSAEAYEGEKIRYFVDLIKLNRYLEGQGERSRFHHDITELIPVRNLLRELIQATTTQSNQFISTTHTEFDDEYEVEIIDSPVRLLSTDSLGNQTGVVLINGVKTILENIPGSQYFEFGDTRYFVVPKGTDRTSKLFGEDYGGYSLTTAKLGSTDIQTINTILLNATVTPMMIAEYSNTNSGYSTIMTDEDGDGTNDYEMTLAGELIEEEVEVTYPLLLTTIEGLALPVVKKKALVLIIEGAQFYANKTPIKASDKKLEDKLLTAASKLINTYAKKKDITAEAALKLNEMIQALKDKQ